MSKDLVEIRQQITQLDRNLLKLLSERHRLAYDVVRSKEISQKPLRDKEREQLLLAELVRYSESENYPLSPQYITQIFQKIIEDSVLTQQAYLQNKLNQHSDNTIKIAFLGMRGSYSNLAARQYAERYKKQLVELNCNSFQHIFDQVESGQADYGIVPLENTTSGSINDVYDILQHTDISIVGELTYPIEHCLLSVNDIDISKIDTLYSHPQVISQCSHFIQQLDKVHVQYCESSSHAMQLVSQLNKPNIAALGNAEGGKLYGLHVLKNAIANQAYNMTRFIVIAKQPIEVSPQVQSKTLLLMSTEQKAGALVDALLVFKHHHIQMKKLESRPIYGKPWEEMFYLEIEGNINEQHVKQALAELKEVSRYLKVLGCYPSEIVEPVEYS